MLLEEKSVGIVCCLVLPSLFQTGCSIEQRVPISRCGSFGGEKCCSRVGVEPGTPQLTCEVHCLFVSTVLIRRLIHAPSEVFRTQRLSFEALAIVGRALSSRTSVAKARSLEQEILRRRYPWLPKGFGRQNRRRGLQTPLFSPMMCSRKRELSSKPSRPQRKRRHGRGARVTSDPSSPRRKA